MDKYVKQIQTRMNRRLKARNQSVTKQQVRDVYLEVVKNPDNPTDVEMSRVIELLALKASIQEEAQEENVSDDLVVSSSVEIEKSEIVEITPESHPDLWETLQPAKETTAIAPDPWHEQTPESALAKSETNLPAEQATGGITQSEMTQAIAQAVQQVGEANNAEAIQLLTALASELSADITDVQEMAAALVTAYLNKRQSILATTINTINQCRSAQTESFQQGLNNDFFGQKQKNKEAFLTSVNAMFN